MKMKLPTVTLVLVSLALFGFGCWAAREAFLKDLEAALAVGFFSPARAGVPSFVTPEEEEAIERREQELKQRAQAQAQRWKAGSAALFAAGVIPLTVIFIRSRRARQEKLSSGHGQP